MRIPKLLFLAIPVLTACGHDANPRRDSAHATFATGESPCTTPRRTGALPPELKEASGVTVSRRYPGTLWLHNDSEHGPYIFATDSTGRIWTRVRVEGARNRDWEDIALGTCPAGECIYIADTGNNRLRQVGAGIYRIPEPAPDDTVSATAEYFPVRFPDGPRDVEAMYILPDGSLFLISKGRKHPAELFRYPPPLRPGEAVTLELVQELSDDALPIPYQVTAASATPDGRWVAVRSYSSLQLYRPQPDGTLLPALPPPGITLDPLAEPQGEGVAIEDDGTVFLASEGGPARVPGTIGKTTCDLERLTP